MRARSLYGVWALSLLLVSVASVQAQFICSTNYGRITITGYDGPGGVVIVPGTIHGLPVTGIGNLAFAKCSRLLSVTVLNGPTAIGNGAFFGCTQLAGVTLPNSITSIGNGAFQNCSGLANVWLGKSIISVGDYTFEDCTSLTDFTIGDSVTSIGDHAFYRCSGLVNLTIGDGVKNIQGVAFQDCTSLASVTVGKNVARIWSCAFYDCGSLTEIHFKGNAPVLGNNVFHGDKQATAYYLPETKGWYPTLGGRPTAIATIDMTTPPSAITGTRQDDSTVSHGDSTDIRARLTKLEGLRRSGLVSQEEYDQKRKALLNDL